MSAVDGRFHYLKFEVRNYALISKCINVACIRMTKLVIKMFLQIWFGEQNEITVLIPLSQTSVKSNICHYILIFSILPAEIAC
jgi:hypothetical protein